MKHVIWMLVGVLLAAKALGATVIITSEPRGADVTVDGESVGKTPKRVRLAEGLHDLEVSGGEYATHTETITVGKKLMQVTVKLKPKKYAVDIVLKDDTETGWAIFDGKKLIVEGGKLLTAPTTIKLPKGTHKLRLMKPKFKDLPFTVTVKSGEKDRTVEVLGEPKKGYSSYSRCHKALVVGEWKMNEKFSVVYDADGTITKRENGRVRDRGKWSFAEGEPTVIVGTLSGNKPFRQQLLEDGSRLTGWTGLTRAKK